MLSLHECALPCARPWAEQLRHQYPWAVATAEVPDSGMTGRANALIAWPMRFNIDGSWDCKVAVTPDAESSFNHLFRPNDDSVCVWVDQKSPEILRASFDLDAVDYDEAISRGLDELRKAATGAGLLGGPVRIIAMTDQGQARWSV